MTPLRWKIAVGYLIALVITIVLWKDLEHGWGSLMTFLAPLFAFLTALVALKFGVVIAAISTFIIVFFQGFVGLIVAVAKMGVIKGLFLPWLLAVLQWLHDKSEFLQRWVSRIYAIGKNTLGKVYDWWLDRNLIDRFLLLGFIGPLILIVAFAILVKRFVYNFISRKAAEQVVQKATKATVKHFHKVPAVGEIPDRLKLKVSELKQKRDKKLAQAHDKPESQGKYS